mmetsp:Transcript_9141/g.27660  ORF Transcript_9141/g.27660 Transcript_9141/m.27660 type:complete len:244 (-) Transcript_9141:9-740(-)
MGSHTRGRPQSKDLVLKRSTHDVSSSGSGVSPRPSMTPPPHTETFARFHPLSRAWCRPYAWLTGYPPSRHVGYPGRCGTTGYAPGEVDPSKVAPRCTTRLTPEVRLSAPETKRPPLGRTTAARSPPSGDKARAPQAQMARWMAAVSSVWPSPAAPYWGSETSHTGDPRRRWHPSGDSGPAYASHLSEGYSPARCEVAGAASPAKTPTATTAGRAGPVPMVPAAMPLQAQPGQPTSPGLWEFVP